MPDIGNQDSVGNVEARLIRVSVLSPFSQDAASWAAMLEAGQSHRFSITHHGAADADFFQPQALESDLLLLDLHGVEPLAARATVTALRAATALPIVALGDGEDEKTTIDLIEAGADEYLAKNGIAQAALFRAVFTALQHRELIRRLEDEREYAVHVANHDRITDLENRSTLDLRLSQVLSAARRSRRNAAVLFVEVSGLKSVNDSLGHAAGDQFLRDVAERLIGSVRLSDDVAQTEEHSPHTPVSHLGGSEFTVLASEISDARDAAHVAQRIITVLSEPFPLEGQEVFAKASIGIAVYPFDGADASALLRGASTAKERAKSSQASSFRFFAQSMNRAAVKDLKLTSLLHRALERQELSLHYQPMRNARTGKVIAAEALLRWKSAELGDISPVEFIPVAEQTGLIVPIGEWVLREATGQCQRWQEAGFHPIRLAVNLSARQLQQEELAETVTNILRESGLSASQLELEITETTIMQGGRESDLALEQLRDLGVGFALDDFGTGYSTLTHLRRFPVGRLKIDRSFVSEIVDKSEDADIAAALIAMAHSLNLEIVAEGVETLAQAAFLRERGCDELQGFLLGRPVPPEDFVPFLEKAKPR